MSRWRRSRCCDAARPGGLFDFKLNTARDSGCIRVRAQLDLDLDRATWQRTIRCLGRRAGRACAGRRRARAAAGRAGPAPPALWPSSRRAARACAAGAKAGEVGGSQPPGPTARGAWRRRAARGAPPRRWRRRALPAAAGSWLLPVGGAEPRRRGGQRCNNSQSTHSEGLTMVNGLTSLVSRSLAFIESLKCSRNCLAVTRHSAVSGWADGPMGALAVAS